MGCEVSGRPLGMTVSTFRTCHTAWKGELDIGQVVLDHLLAHLVQLVSDGVDPAACLVVQLAVVPDKLDIVESLLDVLVLAVHQLLLHCAQIHGVLHDKGVIGQSHP